MIFFSYFELFRMIDIFPILTLIITLLRNVMLTMPKELGLPVGKRDYMENSQPVCTTIPGAWLIVMLIFVAFNKRAEILAN